MINIKDLSIKVKEEGYEEEMAEAKICQDIVLLLLSKSKFNKNITIKGGVVMRSLSNNIRRATVDIDLDLIKYPLNVKGIRELIKELNGIEGIKIRVMGNIEDLKHQDYNGKRVYVNIEDAYGNYLTSKIDIGVHKYLSLQQEEYCFDISSSSDGASLLINSKEQMFTEKLKSLLKFGSLSTRFKDIYDMYYLSNLVNKNELNKCFDILIFQDSKMRESTLNDIVLRIKSTFSSQTYLDNLSTSDKNWVGEENNVVLNKILIFLESLEKQH